MRVLTHALTRTAVVNALVFSGIHCRDGENKNHNGPFMHGNEEFDSTSRGNHNQL